MKGKHPTNTKNPRSTINKWINPKTKFGSNPFWYKRLWYEWWKNGKREADIVLGSVDVIKYVSLALAWKKLNLLATKIPYEFVVYMPTCHNRFC